MRSCWLAAFGGVEGDLGRWRDGRRGPTGNRYGDAAGHGRFAVVGPVEEAATLETAIADRHANMEAFAGAALRLLLTALTRPS